MKKNLIKPMAVTMALTLLMSTSAFASAAVTTTADKTIAATSTVDSATYSILLPTTIAVVTNPLGLSGKPQVYTTPITVANRSSAAVMVTAKFQAVTATTNAPVLTAVGKVNSFDTGNTAKQYSLVAKPIRNTGAMTVSAAVLTEATTPKLSAITENNYVSGTNVWQLPADGSGLSTGHYAVIGETAATDTNDLSANLQFLLGAYASAATVALDATSILTQAAGFMLSGELNPFASWAANDIKANVIFKIAPMPSSVTDALKAAKTAEITTDALNVVGVKHANTALTGTTELTKLPVGPATATAVTYAQAGAGFDINLNNVEGKWTIDATDIKILNTTTGVTSYVFAGAADVTFTATVTSGTPAPAKITVVADKLFKDATDGAISAVDGATATGSYKLAIPMVEVEADGTTPTGVVTTIFVTITLAAA